MEPGTPLLALRLDSLSHALEPGRDYLLGSADDCDLRIAGAAPHHAQLCVRDNGVTLVVLATEPACQINDRAIAAELVGGPVDTAPDATAPSTSAAGEHPQGEVGQTETGQTETGRPETGSAATAELAAGDRLTIAGEIAILIVDDGTAAVVPIPALRQAAVARRMAAVRIAAAALRRHDGETFQQLIAHELRRTPWLLTSLVLHLLLLLLLWLLVPAETVGGRSIATLGFDVAASATLGDGPPAPPAVTIEEVADDELLEDPQAPTPDQPVPIIEAARPRPNEPPTENVQLAPRQRTRRAGDGRNAIFNEHGIGSGSFRKIIADLQESGLEIVFVFDSTGSMTRTIYDTKTTIVQMLDVLRTLVPDARVGLVTYRDRGRREDYIVRQVPLDLDYWRASNFVQFVVAEGGGDRPEDVRAGLNAAFRQDWRQGARRVVVLAGDAPPHREDYGTLLEEVRHFSRDRRSFVHTLVTSPDRAGDDTLDIFTAIAKAGRGECEPIENRDRVLQRVLTLAFGREFDRDLKDVIRVVEQERDRVDVESLHLVKTGGKALRNALRQRPVRSTLWNALVRRPRQSTATTLLDLLGNGNTPAHTRQAAAAALQRILELPMPPIDADTGEPPSERRLERLMTLARRLPQ